jgi:steroid delta-isomerase-like uncharacterized protein
MTSATTRTPAEVARAAFDAILSRDPDGIVAVGAPGYADDFVAIGEVRGHEAVRGFFSELFAAFPDFEMTVDRIVADETSAAVQWHAAGTFTGGPFQGILPTGRRIEIRGADVMEISGGLIQHNTIYYDGAAFARQIGMLPARGSRADQALLAAFNAKTRLIQRYRNARHPGLSSPFAAHMSLRAAGPDSDNAVRIAGGKVGGAGAAQCVRAGQFTAVAFGGCREERLPLLVIGTL